MFALSEKIIIMLLLQIKGTMITCFLVGISSANMCDVSAPQVALSELDAGCDASTKSRSPECVAAIHNFCIDLTLPPNKVDITRTPTGVSRGHSADKIDVSCILTEWVGRDTLQELQRYNSGCTSTAGQNSQSPNCLSAIQQHCQATLGGQRYAGISQVIESSFSLYVKCFKSSRNEDLLYSILQEHNRACASTNSASDDCFSAASGWCVQQGYSGGITQGASPLNDQKVRVSCYNAEFSNHVYMTKTNDYFLDERTVDRVCSLDFIVDQGTILSQTPVLLKMEMYDNRASSVPLRTTFQTSKTITLRSSFTHSSNFRFTASASLTVNIPFVGNGKVETSVTQSDTVSLTTERLSTASFSVESPVEVPAGRGINVEAVVQSASLDVPWSAKVVNRLGATSTIGGTWRGVDAFGVDVEQKDIDSTPPNPCPTATTQ